LVVEWFRDRHAVIGWSDFRRNLDRTLRAERERMPLHRDEFGMAPAASRRAPLAGMVRASDVIAELGNRVKIGFGGCRVSVG
jgi:hypothetical protein